jgi:formylglycine-generating enzyme required for sulfatase activity
MKSHTTRCLVFVGVTVAAMSAAQAQDSSHKVEIVTNSLGMKLSRIPAGTFQMGSAKSEPERRRDEAAHEVTITKPFLIGLNEVTQTEFRRILGNKVDKAVFKGPNRPMDNVTWEDAGAFCRALSQLPTERNAGRKYRLPTEAEWEYACRAGTKSVFHFGDSLSAKQANFNGRYPYREGEAGAYLRRTVDVGSYKPNAFGLHDMHGNVAEWCSDWYDKEYYYDSPAKDPLGPPVGVTETGFNVKRSTKKKYYLSVRGGCWLDDARACRSACRFKGMPEINYRLIGFRVVCESAASTSN